MMSLLVSCADWGQPKIIYRSDRCLNDYKLLNERTAPLIEKYFAKRDQELFVKHDLYLEEDCQK